MTDEQETNRAFAASLSNAGLGLRIDAHLRQLAATAHDKGERYKMLGMMNTPSDPDEKKQSAIEYAIARGEMIDASNALRTRLMPNATQPPKEKHNDPHPQVPLAD